MQNINRAISRLHGQTIQGDSVDWKNWLKPSDVSRIVPAEDLAEQCKEAMLLGREVEEGLTLPWAKSHGKVLIKPGKLAIWTGFSHHGKSSLLKQLMLHAIYRGDEKIVIASMEEEIGEVWQDMARLYAGVADPSPRVIDAFINFVRGKLWLYDQQGVVEADRMTAVLRYAASELKTTQGVVDSLMMLAVSRDDYDAQSRFVGELKSAAKDTQQTIHLVAHMRKRDGKTGDESPGSVHDISGGHEIASKADYVFNVWRNKKETTEPTCLLGVEKQRGKTNWIGKIGLYFHPGSRQFVENPHHPIIFYDEVRDGQRRAQKAQSAAVSANGALHRHNERTDHGNDSGPEEPDQNLQF